jgi:transcriptional regulator with XRE-family HTH domain
MVRKTQLHTLLRNARLAKGWTLLQVAEVVGVSDGCVSHWESGRSIPRDNNLTAVCKALKVSVRQAREIAAR